MSSKRATPVIVLFILVLFGLTILEIFIRNLTRIELLKQNYQQRELSRVKI